jgi:hypothetical protein
LSAIEKIDGERCSLRQALRSPMTVSTTLPVFCPVST